MKKDLIKFMLIAGTLSALLTSCDKNKILTPNYEVTSQQVYSTPLGYNQAMAKVYASFSLTGNQGPAGSGDIAGIDEGTSDFFRLLFYAQELPTDEAVLAWGDPGVPDFHNMNWSSSNVILLGLYERCLYQINIANEFIRQSDPSVVSKNGISGTDAATIAQYRLEARFLRAYQYANLMDLFANPPFATENSVVGSIPPQTDRATLFKYVESELLSIAPQMAAPMKNQYGRADEGAAWALLARIYLNAQVYTGTARYADAMTYAQKVISAGYSLIPNYDNLFLADNNNNVTENIFSIEYDGNTTQGYGGTTFMTHAPVGGSMQSPLYGITGGWAGLRTTSALISKFPNPSTETTSNFPNNSNQDTRAEFWYPGQNETISSITSFTDGLGVNKWRNITSTGTPGQNLNFSDVDEPIFRLSEQYLIYAEADIRLNNSASSTSLNYINLIRERAYGGKAGDIQSTDLTLQFILDERARELYWEGFRRSDLIRYGQFTTSTYLWPFKGGVSGGTSVADFRNIYPIPDQDRAANPNLKQNPGY